MRPEGRGAGVPRDVVQRGRVRREGSGDSQTDAGAQPLGQGREGRKAGEGGREGIRGGNNIAGAAPAEFRFRTPPPRFDFGTSRRLPGAAQDAGSGAARAPSAPRPGGSGGHRLAGEGGTAGRGTVPTASRPGVRPTRTPPRQDPPGRVRGGAGAGGRRRARRRQPSSARPGIRWEEAHRPGERKRGPDPPPAAARLREGACPACGGAWAGGAWDGGAAPPAGLRGHYGGCVRAHALPPLAPVCPR